MRSSWFACSTGRLCWLRVGAGATAAPPKILVVNLDRSPQRWESAQEGPHTCRHCACLEEFRRENLQVERFSGTDGKAMSQEELEETATCGVLGAVQPFSQ